jgi:hypothetical protein
MGASPLIDKPNVILRLYLFGDFGTCCVHCALGFWRTDEGHFFNSTQNLLKWWRARSGRDGVNFPRA